MNVTKASAARCIMVMVILLSVGCSIFQPARQEIVASETPGRLATKQASDSPQDARSLPPPKVPPETPGPLATKQASDSLQDVRPLLPPKAKDLNHKIKWPGENLSLIARWYTGSAKNWTRLVEANPGIEPRRIKIGDSILIPADLLKTRQPMPVEFMSSAPSPPKTLPSSSAKKAGNSDNIDLFGPVDTEAQKSDAGDIDSPLPLETIE